MSLPASLMPISEMCMSRPGSPIPATAALQKAQITQSVLSLFLAIAPRN
jgi:hypothetical protein